MDIQELRQKTEAELEKMLVELKNKLRDLGFRVARRELKNVREIRVVKRTIAMVLTILSKKK